VLPKPTRRSLGVAALCLGVGLILECGAATPAADSRAGAGAAAAAARRARSEVAALLAVQSAAWNRGDVAAFTAVYAEDATFVAPSGLTHGRAAVLARYRRRYPDRRAMGTLSLEILEARALGGERDAAAPAGVAALSVVAHWRLSYPEEPGRRPAEGSTLLVLQKSAGGWQIVQDASM
jgi:uncharacterized protein (TIGR02246 family)